jgi:uncharacterized membrane protein YeaQ/YmgE (transglycosylase-associated protein family)
MVLQILGLIVIGLVIGALARLVVPGRQAIGFFRTLLVGVAGAVISGILVSLIGWGDVFELNFVGFILAVVVTVVLLVGAERAGLLQDPKRRQLEQRPR